MGRFLRVGVGIGLGLFFALVAAIGIGLLAKADGPRLQNISTIAVGILFAYAGFRFAGAALGTTPKQGSFISLLFAKRWARTSRLRTSPPSLGKENPAYRQHGQGARP